ncbi:hypothetical protein EDD85DRAFT_839729 [Armillaria nabsnona]|nr:hypothetical protein EDD85DRAFT_839729 [Armillaria nabsnona]
MDAPSLLIPPDMGVTPTSLAALLAWILSLGWSLGYLEVLEEQVHAPHSMSASDGVAPNKAATRARSSESP